MKFSTVKLGDYLYIKGRIGWKGLKKSEYINEGNFRIINGESLTKDGIDWSKSGFITKERYEESPEIMLQEGDILISKDGTIGKLGYIDHLEMPSTVASGIFVLRNLKPEIINTRFIYNYLSSIYFKNFITARTEGSVIPHLYQKDFVDLDFPLPKLDIQDKIVDILDAIAYKIELNNKINNNLEEQAQAIFKSWFVDFIPFGGVMPSDWIVTNIYSVTNIIYGAPFSSKLLNSDGIGTPIIRIRDLKEQVFTTFTTEEHPKGHLIQPGDIVVGMDGEFRPYIWGNEPAWLNQRVCIFENKRPLGKAFVLNTIKPLLNKVEQTQVATTVIHIGKKDFDAFKIILPNEATLDRFDMITNPLIEKIINNRLQNKRLTQLRDALLPKLMSGEIDVSNISI